MDDLQSQLDTIVDTYMMKVRSMANGRDISEWKAAFRFALENPNDRTASQTADKLLAEIFSPALT